MNPLNRRMFRDPRAARRATGILASSAPLMTAAQKAMAQGQPVKAQTGASVNTRRRTLLQDLAALPSDVRAGLGQIFRNMPSMGQIPAAQPRFPGAGFNNMGPVTAAPGTDLNISGMESAQATAQKLKPVTDQLIRFGNYPLEVLGFPVPDEAPGVRIPYVSNSPQRVGRDVDALLYPAGGPAGESPTQTMRREADENAASMDDLYRRTVEALRLKKRAEALSGADMDPEGVVAEEAGIASLPSDTVVSFSNIDPIPPGRTAADDPSNSSSVPLSAAERARLNALKELRETKAAPGVETTETSDAPKAPETVAPTSAELLAQAKQNTEAARDEITATKPEAADIDSEGVVAGESALAAQEATSAERRADRSPGRGVTSTTEQARANDELLGIEDTKPDGDPLTRKERVEQRYQLLKDLLGEDKAKDIRTDKNYNLMMLGLRIAAGQSEDALSNIAAGAGQQLQEFGEVSGEISQQEAQDERAIKLQAANEVGAEMAAEAERKYQTGRAEDEQAFLTAERLGGEQAAIALADVNNAARAAMQSTQLSWQAAEKALDREAAELLANSEQQFRLALTNINQTFQGEQNALNREEAYNRLVMTHDFQAREAAKGRVHDLDKLMAAQEHAMEMGLSDQAFRISLANFTAGIPGETQKLYEKYLEPDQIAELIVSKVTGDTKLLQGYDEDRFIQDALKDQNRRDAATDEIIAKFKKENPGMEVPNIGENELSAFFADVYKQAGFGKND